MPLVPDSGQPSGGRAGLSPFPGFREMAERRRRVIGQLVAERHEQGLSQTVVAARMGTSQSVVARVESGDNDVRLSTLERYAAALGLRLDWELRGE
ncbi:MAG: helix-turn-helix domain-containing protein [Actinomycetota bacterium]|nr:helix-turn-helix domain-containing protein [Actinomycetota bacterium]